MINPDDPKEWLAQIEARPEAAPAIARLLISRLSRLEETNEELRNTNLELRQKIDTRAHQKEVEELRRQIEALARLVKARSKGHAPGEALLAWSSNGHALAIDLDSGDLDETSLLVYAFRFPAPVKLQLLAVPLAEEILFLTNQGQGGTFKVEELVKVTQEAARWHKIPDLNLNSDEFISAMTLIGDFPLSHSLITASRNGYARSILRWSLDRFLQEGQFGKGVKEDQDFQTCAGLCFSQSSNILLFTKRGKYLRFPESDLSSSLVQGLKLDRGDYVAGMILDDQPGTQVLIIDSEGKGARRSLKSFKTGSAGLKPQPACVAEDVVGVSLVSEYDQVVALMENGRLAMFDVDEAPLSNRSRPLSPLPAITARVQAFTSARSF